MSGAAFADPAASPSAAPASPPADPAKWVPYAQIGGGVGSGFTVGKLDFFEPVWQDLDSMLYARAGVQLAGQDDRVWNFGLGYRTKVNPDWIVGGFAGFDSNDTAQGHTVHQYSVGLEAMSADWDVRANGYFAPSKLHDVNDFALYIHDTTIAILGQQNAAYSGFDGEVGYRVFNTDTTDVRLFAGGFSFNHSGTHSPIGGGALDFKFHDIQGPQGRVEVNVFDLDDIGPQSRLSFEGDVAHDSVRGTTGFVGATLRIPLGDTAGSGAQALDELDRRMADPQRRMENVINRTIFSKPEPVIIYNGTVRSQPTNTLFYAQQQAAAGEGSYANPTTIQDATSRGPVNQFIVLTDKGGAVDATGTVIQTGETVVGGGQTFQVEGEFSHHVFTHTFAPGSGTPTLTAASSADNILTVGGGNVSIDGLNFVGPFANAIYGHNINNLTIDDVTIDGTGGGVNGIHVVQDVSGDATLTIANSSVSGVSNDGVLVNNTFSDGGTTTENVHLDNTTVTGSGNDGVYVDSNVTGGSTATLNTELTSSSITGSGAIDVLMAATVGVGSSATQNITIDPTTISGGIYGVKINGIANGGSLTQNVTISDVNFSGQTISGVAAFAYAENGGTMNQTVNLTNVNVTGSYFPIAIIDNAATGGTSTQTFALSNVNVTGGRYEGIDIVGHADGAGSTVHQYGTLNGVTANNTSLGDGVYAYAESTYGGTTIQRLNVTNLSATHNYFDGLYVGVSATSTTADASTAAQYVHVADSDLAGNFIGFEASAGGTGNATAAQNIFVGNTVFSDAAHAAPGYQVVGASVEAFAFDQGSVQQYAFFLGDTATNNTASGLVISASSFYAGFIEQTAQVYGTAAHQSQFTNNNFGISVGANASAGGDIEQNVGIYFANLNHNAGGGLTVETNSYGIAVGYSLYYSHISQNIVAAYDHFDHNGGDGIAIVNYAQYGAQINQFVEMFDSTARGNTGNGMSVTSHDIGASVYGYAPSTNLYSDIYVIGSTLDHNTANGLSIKSDVTMPTNPAHVFGFSYGIEHIYVGGNSHLDHNGASGLYAQGSAEGIYSLDIEYLTVAGATFDGNTGNGATFAVSQNFGPYSFGAAIQDVTIQGGDFSHNAGDGLHATADASGFQGRAEQHFTIQGSNFDSNQGDGMSFANTAHDGVYVPGYGCNYIQGVIGGCAFVRQTIDITNSDISGNIGNGIDINSRATNYGAIYSSSGRPLYTPTLELVGTTVDGNFGDGVHLYNYVAGHSYGYQYVVALDSHFDNNHGNGIGSLSNVNGNSQLVQKVVVYGLASGSTASGNHGDGIAIDSQATNGGKIGNLLVVGYSTVAGNHGDGISVAGGGDSGAGTVATGVAQYIDIVGSNITGNHGYGLDARSRATGAYATTYQYISVVGSTVAGNGDDGVHAFEIAYGASAADQSLYFNNDAITGNHGDGVYAVSIAVDQSFTEQNLLFGYHVPGITNLTYNTGDGLYAGTAAFSGANAEQNVFIYNVNSSHNHGDGVGIGAGTNGYSFGSSYIYYSHVSQNVIAAYDTFDRNRGDGMAVSDVAYYGGAMNQLIEAIDVDMSRNGGAGFYMTSHLTSIRGNSFSFSTNMNTMLYLIGDTMTLNAGNGIDLRSYANGAVYAPAFFGGYNYDQHHQQIQGTNSSDNGGSGLAVLTSTAGRYSLNADYVTISGSTFDHNGVDGAGFTSNDYYGPGGFGVSLQQVSISGSSFNNNIDNGLGLSANASGFQGRAEQHFTVTGSDFNHNGGDGVHIYASAINGTYVATHPCTSIQGLTGGCAFVRQNVLIVGSDMNANGNNGVALETYANNYGAIYGVSGRPHAPTLELYGDTVSNNNGRGLDVSNHVSDHSYLYQYVATLDTHFDFNHSDGVYAASYVGGGSTMLQLALIYTYHTGASAHNNAGNGAKFSIEALGGSYARDVNIVQGANLSNNGSFGFDGAVAYADGTSTGLQINAVYFNTISHNGDGVGLYSIGGGAQQISHIGDNDIIANSFVGVYGEANFGAFQYIGVYTFGNTVHSNGTNYLFNSFGGSTQILN